MVEVKTDVSLRAKRRRERIERIMAAKPQGRSKVRVVPTDEKYRVLKHPSGIAFRPEGSIEWPNDRFTKRRIAEGVIKVEQADERNKQPQQHHRRRTESATTE
jgi:hypothetical protein